MHSLSYFLSEVICLNINHESKYRISDTSFKDFYTSLSALIPSCKRPLPCSTRCSRASTRVPSKKASMKCFTCYYFYRRVASVRDPEAVLGRTQLDGLSNNRLHFWSVIKGNGDVCYLKNTGEQFASAKKSQLFDWNPCEFWNRLSGRTDIIFPG